MRVLFDGVVFESSHQIGVWRVFFEILSRLSAAIDVTILLRNKPRMPLPAGCRIVQDTMRAPISRWNLFGRIKRRLADTLTPGRLAGHDLFHSTFFTPSPVPGLPTVVTVHDMIPELLPYHCAGADLQEQVQRKRDSMASADRIVAISHATAAAIRQCYPMHEYRTVVVHSGAEHLGCADELPASPGSDSATEKYALFVGYRYRYKNFSVVLDAIKEADWPNGCKLYVVGDPISDTERGYFQSLGIADRIVDLGRIPDERLAIAYRNASCFIYASFMEGFGLPLLEAQSQGCPVVCSDTSCFREIAGSAAVFFNPKSPSELAQAVGQASQPTMRHDLQLKGVDNIRRFSWDRCVTELLNVYRSILGDRNRS